MAIQFAKQVKDNGKTEEEIRERIMIRGCYGVAEEWHRGIETVINYAKDELHMVDPPLFGKNEHKDNDTLRREIVLEMFAYVKELEEQNNKLKQAIAERNAEDRKRDALQHIDYSNLYDDVHKRRMQFRAQVEAN